MINFPGAILANKFLFYMTSARRILVYERAIWEGFRDHEQFKGYLRTIGHHPLIKIYDPDFMPGSVMTFNTWSKIPVYFRLQMVDFLLQRKEIYLAALTWCVITMTVCWVSSFSLCFWCLWIVFKGVTEQGICHRIIKKWLMLFTHLLFKPLSWSLWPLCISYKVGNIWSVKLWFY